MTRLIGAHMSIAGGYHLAAEAAADLGMTTVQIFTKNNAQWKAKPITEAEANCFRTAIEDGGLQQPCSHASYLINLASPRDELRQKSIDAMVIELGRAEQLGLSGVVLHPGTATDCGEEEGIANVIASLDTVLQKTTTDNVEIWLESTAGQGSSLGHRFEHLAEIIDGAKDPSRLGVCLDTCHLFAAGYPLATAKEYRETWKSFDETIGRKRLRAFHLNDSKKPFASRVDRHEHIGEGHLGLEPFRRLMNDSKLSHLPMYLETPKGRREGTLLDEINLDTLLNLVKSPRSTATRRKPNNR